MVFPDYTRAERMLDRCVHIVGVPLGLAAAIWLMLRVIPHGSAVLIVSIAIYAFGLIGMLGSSAAYQMMHHGLLKERLRRLDRAMIFVMIAGTYTPISANVLYGRGGVLLCALQWALAGIGIFLTLRFPRRFERSTFALYLAMGWMLVVLLRECFALLPQVVLVLIVAGGVAYTIGAVIQSFPKLKFNNPVWHALVLLAASLQFAAITLEFKQTLPF